MNCKPGCMAWCKESSVPEHVGMIVTVGALVEPDGLWEITFSGTVTGIYGETLRGSGLCWDQYLVPINDPGLSVDTAVEKTLEAV